MNTVTSIHINRLKKLGQFIGNTPLLDVTPPGFSPAVKVYAKAEWQQFGGSVKSRPAYHMIYQAVVSGLLDDNRRLLDASSGNTGVAIASIAAATGIPVTLCIPENASYVKKKTLELTGAELIYTSRFEGTDGAQIAASDLSGQYPGDYVYLNQYDNPNNWKAHYQSTAVEILKQTAGTVTHFVCGLGTTGTFTGTSKRLKKENPGIKTIALQPDIAMHGLEGWKYLETARTPAIYDPALIDQTLTVSTEEAYEFIQKAARWFGLLLSPSSAANLRGAVKVAESIDRGVVVTVFPDYGTNYPEILNDL